MPLGNQVLRGKIARFLIVNGHAAVAFKLEITVQQQYRVCHAGKRYQVAFVHFGGEQQHGPVQKLGYIVLARAFVYKQVATEPVAFILYAFDELAEKRGVHYHLAVFPVNDKAHAAPVRFRRSLVTHLRSETANGLGFIGVYAGLIV